MATIIVQNSSGKPISGLRVRAVKTGGYGSEDATTNFQGCAFFSDTANRVQIEINNGNRWVQIGNVLRSLRGENIVIY